MYCKRKEPVRGEYCGTAGRRCSAKGFLFHVVGAASVGVADTIIQHKLTYIPLLRPYMKGMSCAHYTISSYIRSTYIIIIYAYYLLLFSSCTSPLDCSFHHSIDFHYCRHIERRG